MWGCCRVCLLCLGGFLFLWGFRSFVDGKVIEEGRGRGAALGLFFWLSLVVLWCWGCGGLERCMVDVFILSDLDLGWVRSGLVGFGFALDLRD